MSNSRYYVVGDYNVWIIECAVAEPAQPTSRRNAMAFATYAAQALGMRGQRAHVCALDDDGRFRSVWRQEDIEPPASGTSRVRNIDVSNDHDEFKSRNAAGSVFVLG